MAATLNFCVKRKSAFISETVRDIAISMKFLTRRVSAESTDDFPKNRFPAIFDGHLDFLRKTQNHIYLRNSANNSFMKVAYFIMTLYLCNTHVIHSTNILINNEYLQIVFSYVATPLIIIFCYGIV